MSIKKLLILLVGYFIVLELFIILTNFYYFHWILKEHKIDGMIILGLLIYFVDSYKKMNNFELEAENYYKVFALFFVFIIAFKALMHFNISYNYESETVYITFNEIFFDKLFLYFLSVIGNIWVGIWLGNGNGKKFWLKPKTKIYSSSDGELIQKMHKLFADYQIESSIENKISSFDLMINDNKDRIKAMQLIDSMVNNH